MTEFSWDLSAAYDMNMVYWFSSNVPCFQTGIFLCFNLLCRFFYSWRQHIYSFDWENIWKLCLYTM